MRSNLDRADRLWEFMDKQEERAYYEDTLQRVINDPRFYLQNLDDPTVLSTFRVRFLNYKPLKGRTKNKSFINKVTPGK